MEMKCIEIECYKKAQWGSRAVSEAEEHAQETGRSALHDARNVCVGTIFLLFSAFQPHICELL